MALTGVELALVGLIVTLGGLLTGVTGFGYAIFATATLASVLDPQTAVVIVIIPIVAANLSLVRELDRAGFRSCLARFWLYVATAAVGTVVGMALLPRVPATPLAAGLGAFTLAYVAVSQPWWTLPGETWLARTCFTDGTLNKGLLGLVSGFVFGLTNAGVQVIAYLESLDLDHRTFVGVVAMVFLGIGGIRIGSAWLFGLYSSPGLVGVSMTAAVPGLVGVAAGKRFRSRLAPTQRDAIVYVLLTVIGIRLLSQGLELLA